MRLSNIFAASAALALISFGSMAQAADSDWNLSVGSGSTTVEQDNGFSSPSARGASLELALGHDLMTIGDITFGLETGVKHNWGDASERSQTCDVPSCGYVEYGTWTESSPWSGKLGINARHPLGPVDVSVAAGVQVNQLVHESSYDSGGKVTYASKYTELALGPYWRAGADYAFGDNWSAGLAYEHADLTRSKWSSTFGGGSDKLNADTWFVRINKKL
ncbi:MAG: outer membrane beta-barrel protein [Candidatus Pacebacteria bacterium]|nr:outer membrane beta-barrel protein [Candidatus Paceibacterota bacterium]